MSNEPSIQIERIHYGPFPEAPRLNPKLSPELPLLLATLVIAWEPDDAPQAIARLEESLIAFSPRFRSHECRGADRYHVFRHGGSGEAKRDGNSGHRGASAHRNGYSGPLALAHLLEHALIDFQCSITGLKRCSGATAQRADADNRFDVMVECPDPRAGRCCLGLAIAWLQMALAGRPPGLEEREILDVAGIAYQDGDRKITSATASRRLRVPADNAERALQALAEVGYLTEVPWAMNLSGLRSWTLCSN